LWLRMNFTSYEFEENEAYGEIIDADIKIDTNYFLECPTRFSSLFKEELTTMKEYTTMKQKTVNLEIKENFQSDVLYEVELKQKDKTMSYAPDEIGELRVYKRANPMMFNDIFKKLGLAVGRFHGSMVMTLNQYELKRMDYKEYVFSKKLDGIRGWLICKDRRAYFQDRKNLFYFICEFDSDGDFVFDCELIRYKGSGQNTFVLYDIILCNGHLEVEKTFAQRIDILQYFDLKKLLTVGNNYHSQDSFVLQKFYTLDAFEHIDMHEGVVFEYLLGMYEFKATRYLLSWKKCPRTVDLMYKDGKLYSAYYNKNKTLKELRYEGEVFNSLKYRKDQILECYPWEREGEERKKGSKRSFVVSRERKDKQFPNAAYVVDDILAENKCISYRSVCQEFRKFRRIYGDGIQYSLYPIGKSKEMVQIRFEDVYLYCVIYKCAMREMQGIVSYPGITPKTSDCYYDACNDESDENLNFSIDY